MLRLLFVSVCIACVSGGPQGYGVPGPAPGPAPAPSSSYGPPQGPGSNPGNSPGSNPGNSPGNTQSNCADGEVADALGNCVVPEIISDVYAFQEPPSDDVPVDIDGTVPKPKVKVNVLVIKTNDDAAGGSEPLIIPPPQEKTLVLVLSKKGAEGGQQVIEVPAPPGQKPEVFFVNYGEGDNPRLPGGIDLLEALDLLEDLDLAAEAGGSVGQEGRQGGLGGQEGGQGGLGGYGVGAGMGGYY